MTLIAFFANKPIAPLLTSILLAFCASQLCVAKVENDRDAINYLEKYGYLNKRENVAEEEFKDAIRNFQRFANIPATGKADISNKKYLSNLWLKNVAENVAEEELKDAIRNFQRFANIPATDEVDVKTRDFMNRPRCGAPDMIPINATDKLTNRRYATKSKWSKNALTYTINYSTNDLTEAQINTEIDQAFQDFADITPLTFTRITCGTPDITIDFVEGNHGDGSNNAFDGAGGVAAHAFYPEDGKIHFDDAETWSTDRDTDYSLYQIGLHEIGHALGLKHSDVEDGLMWPYIPFDGIHADDVKGIQALYGRKSDDRWRYDLRCGSGYSAPNGLLSSECNPYGRYPCCDTSTNMCENNDDASSCPADYSLKQWRDDLSCGDAEYIAPNYFPAECDPDGIYPCCSSDNVCGNTAAHCTCDGCIDYSKDRWRSDLRCGPGYPAPNGMDSAECDPLSDNPCCSPGGECGNTKDHCYCDGCTDYSQRASLNCFHGKSLVYLENGESKRLEDVEIGDHVLASNSQGDLEYSEVLMYLDRKPEQKAMFYVVETEAITPHPSSSASIILTSSHLIYVSNSNATTLQDATLTYAGNIQVGQYLYKLTGADRKAVVPAKVRGIRQEIKTGAYAPLTTSGSIVVDGHLASCYAMVEHDTAHLAFSPVRALHAVVPSFVWNHLSTTSKGGEGGEGVHWYAHGLSYLANILLDEEKMRFGSIVL